MSDLRFPRTTIIPYGEVVKATLQRLGYPIELMDTHDFDLHGDVSPDKGSFTLTLLSARPKAAPKPEESKP